MGTIGDRAGGKSIDQLIADFDPDSGTDLTTQDKVELADAVIASQDSLCNPEGGLVSDNEICDNIDNAIAESGGATEADKIELINKFFENLESPST